MQERKHRMIDFCRFTCRSDECPVPAPAIFGCGICKSSAVTTRRCNPWDNHFSLRYETLGRLELMGGCACWKRIGWMGSGNIRDQQCVFSAENIIDIKKERSLQLRSF